MRLATLLFALSVVLMSFAPAFFASAQPSMEESDDYDADEVDPTTAEAVRAVQPPAGVEFPYVLMLAEDSCKLRKKFPGARIFVHEHAPYYPTLVTKLAGGTPRVHFFTDKKDYDDFVIDYTMSKDHIMEMLTNLEQDPNFYDPKHTNVEVLFSWETSEDDIVDLLRRFNVPRSNLYHPKRVVTLQEGLTDAETARSFPVPDLTPEQIAPADAADAALTGAASPATPGTPTPDAATTEAALAAAAAAGDLKSEL